MYIQRNNKGQITQASAQQRDDCPEYLADNHPELQAFVGANDDGQDSQMRESDLDFIRVLEDVIGLLIEKDVIRFTDLPREAQSKLEERQTMRSRINSVGLLGDADDDQGLI